jgi:putative ABC transport system substrate-binding protein
MRRWQFAAAVGAPLCLPLAGLAQETAPKVVAYLGTQSPEPFAERVRAFVQGLAETGQIEGRDVMIEYRWANGNSDKLPALASELARRQPAVIVSAGSVAAARAAKAATTSIPIVFEVAAEPVEAGLVKSLTEPNGNLTGVVALDGGIAALHELAPAVGRIGVLINPASNGAANGWNQAQTAARILGVRLQGLLATNEREFDAVFNTLRRSGAGALVISADPVFTAKSEQLAALTLRHKVPAVHESRRFAAAGGLLSFNGNTLESHRLAGIYAGRLLRGEKPAELPIQTTSQRRVRDQSQDSEGARLGHAGQVVGSRH